MTVKRMGKIEISGHEYEWIEDDDLRNDDGQPLDGWYKVTAHIIYVKAGLKPRYKRAVLFHEIVHGIMEHAGIEDRESIADAVSWGLQSVKINGKRLVK